jgi:hypothetical protein
MDMMDANSSFDDLVKRHEFGGFLGSPTEHFGIPSYPPTYVKPTFRVILEGASPITLVAARGAMGKTTTARALSASLSAPLWSLESDRSVSGDALEARLREYGNDLLSPTSKPLVVVDSLDEARLRVSGVSWQEFAESIVHKATAFDFILLGRDRVVDDFWVLLDDLGIGARYLELSHFDTLQRVEYVDLRLRGVRNVDSDQMYSAARALS